jgi:glycosyltransferase involved in cell wall biosynthesis
MVLLEAMSFGLPIVATNIPTTRDIIKDEINGYLCPVGDVECIAKKIRDLLSDQDLQLKIAKRNFAESKKFPSWDKVVMQTFNTIRTHLSDNKPNN